MSNTTKSEVERMDVSELVHIDSKHPAHQGLYKTLDLLRLDTVAGPLFFIVEGSARLDDDAEGKRFFYEEHTCPTNFCRVEAIFTPDDDDPHGVFNFVRSTWMPRQYEADGVERDAILRELFPETLSADPTPGSHSPVSTASLGEPD